MVEAITKLPTNLKKQPHSILAHGEVTGHSHRIEDSKTANLYLTADSLYLEVTADVARLVHQEHATIELPRGIYRVWRQREYSPEEIRIIRD